MERSEFKAITKGSYQDSAEFFDLYEAHLRSLNPTLIIEIGVATGGTSRLFLDLVGAEGHVVGLDIVDDSIAADVLNDPRFSFVRGDSRSDEVYRQVAELGEGADLLLIDGLHTPEGVRSDTATYLPLVRDGGLVLWHDIRLESPQGIKQIWYHGLKSRHFGALDHFRVPYNTGFGLWYKTEETPGTVLAAAEQALWEGDPNLALVHAQRLLDHDPEHAAGRFLHGLAARATGDRRTARRSFAHAKAVSTADPEVASGLLELAQAHGEVEWPTLRAPTLSELRPAALRDLAEAYESDGLLECAQACHSKLAETVPKALLDVVRLLHDRNLSQRDTTEVLLQLLARTGSEGQTALRREALEQVLGTADFIVRLQHFGQAGEFMSHALSLAPEFAPDVAAFLLRALKSVAVHFNGDVSRVLPLYKDVFVCALNMAQEEQYDGLRMLGDPFVDTLRRCAQPIVADQVLRELEARRGVSMSKNG